MNKITPQMVVAKKNSRKELKTLGSNIFYLERRPSEKGRTTLMYNHSEILPKDFDIKSKVHEYGGGAYCLSSSYIVFVNKKDQQLYILDKDFKVTKLTNEENYRFADGVIDPVKNCSYWVAEKHKEDVVTNFIVQVSHEQGKGYGKVKTIAQGEDFYSSPVVYQEQLAFISWSHPNMPWDNTSLNLGSFNNEAFNYKVIDRDAWISEPRFNDDGVLFYLKEEGEWSNLFTFKDGVSSIFHKQEREYANPAWSFGNKSYALYKDIVVASSWENGSMILEHIKDKKVTQVLSQYIGFNDLSISNDNLVVDCYSYNKDVELISIDLNTLITKVEKSAEQANFFVSIPKTIKFKSTDGDAYGFLYLPQNQQTNLPLTVISHGGPTGMGTPFYNISIQYWVDNGFAVFDVNYRGSTGQGKSYRNALKGKWGLLDVDDCANAALYCVEEKIANPEQLIIRGSSAGGYTTMAALTFKDVFKAGASYYGICDLNMLATSTHKFESLYMDELIAPFKTNTEEYTKRSPVNYMNQINCPMIVFQGADDMVVPKEQAQTIYDKLQDKNIACELFIFEEEGHGFSKEENIITCLTKELEFYKKHLIT